ncbi:MAG: hypothetical protein FJ290_15945 [Planctomycetes bacterium]|nr:hypothetical protein [Planctomycetota bacterium]
MRVFYVRPSDNGNYGVEAALGNAQRLVELFDRALFRGLRVPLEPLDFDPREAGFSRLSRYDLVVLAGLDPVVLSPAEQLALVAFVERGGALMLLGGSHSFGNAEGTYLLLEPVLPVRILRGLDVEVNAMPSGSSHPIARGLPTPLGYVSKAHPVEPKPDAQVAMKAGELPFVVAGEYGYGRVVVVASYPECDEAEYGWFFTGDAFDDFFRNALAWLRKEQDPVWFESFSLPNRQVVTGNEEFGRVKLAAAEATALRLTTRLTRGSHLHFAHGRDVPNEDVTPAVAYESSATLQPKRSHETVFSFRVPDDPRARGIHYLAVIAADAEGRELARRDVAIEVVNPTRAALEFEYGRRAFLPGDTAGLRLRVASDLKQPPAEMTLDVSLVDGEGRPLLAPRRRVVRRHEGAYEDVGVALPIPRLRPGSCRVLVELRVGEELADTASEEPFVLAAPPGAGGFPLMADGAHHLDRETAERAVAQLADAGVNTVSVPGPAAQRFGERPHREATLLHAEECAIRRGLSVAHHRRGLLPGLGVATPLSPCPLTPEFRHTIEKGVQPLLAAAAKVPLLRLQEAAARTAVARGQLCRCAACQAAYKRTLGAEMPSEEPAALDVPQRRALASFVTSYWWHYFAALQKARDEVAAGVKLSLAFDASSLLREGPGAPLADPMVWARACDGAEVAAEQDLGRFRLSLAGHQAILAALGKPLGAQLDVRRDAVPVAEAAHTALAWGAAWLRVAENPRFVFHGEQAPLGEALGGLFRRLAKAGLLLARTARPPARVALLFPFTQAMVSGTAHLLDGFELLRGAVGEVDLLHERLVTDEGLAPYAAVALLGTELLPKRVGAALAQFVQRGGLLLADHEGLRDEDGAALLWPADFFGTAETPLFEGVTGRRRRFGSGRTMLFSPDIARAHQMAVSEGDAVATRELRRAVETALAEHGARPRTHSSDPDVEVGLRAAPDTWVLVAVNHSDAPRSARITLDEQAVPAQCAFDLLSGEQVPVERQDGLGLTIPLAPRDGGLWVLYRERPFTLRVDDPTGTPCRGGTLTYKVLVANESGQPARGSHIVRVSVTDPSGEERRELGGERVTAGGVLDVSEPLAGNERCGTWQLCVTDPLTRRVVRRTFEVTEGQQP